MPHTGQRMMRKSPPLAPALTWEAICQLDEQALNLAIEQYCTTHVWHEQTIFGTQTRYILDHRDVQGVLVSTVPHLHYTASWDKTMPLAWRYGIDILAPPWDLADEPAWVRIPTDTTPALRCSDEHACRLAVCRLALWRAVQSQGVTP